MPELPDVCVYLESIERLLLCRRLERLRLGSPFVLRTVDPPPSALEGRALVGTRRLGKRLVLGFEGELFLVIHLMIAGRLRWRARGAALPRGAGLAAFDFENGTLLLTEVSKKKRASIHVVRGEAALAAHDPGGIEPLAADDRAFDAALDREVHTVKRTLTDPRLFAGIGNAYSDEILHRAGLSPVRRTDQLDAGERARLREATRAVLREWLERTRAEVGDAFPEKVTAFREGMAVHGRFGQPCPRCGGPVQRIVHAENESNYCPACQTGGRLLADRALSRLLRGDWPKTLDELEERRRG